MWEFHLPVMVKNARIELVAACSSRAASVERAARQFGIPKTYTEIDRIAEDRDVEAVLVSVPNDLHVPISVKMLESGKEVLCEKPMARTAAEARTMLAAAETTGRKLAIAHPWRCDQDYTWLQGVIRSGRLGKIFKIRAHAVITGSAPAPDNWRCDLDASGGGPLMDLGIHVIDGISFLFDDGLRPTHVWGQTANHFIKTTVEDTATVLIEYEDGMIAEIDSGWHHNFRNSPHGALEVFGTDGYARTFPTELHCTLDGAWGCYRPSLHPDRPHIDASMYATQMDSFIDFVLSGSRPACDGKQGLRNMVLIDAAYASARTGKLVAVGSY
jgi:predicted dehydrogenase